MHVETTAAQRRSFELSATQFLWPALASVGVLWLIMVTGAAVRLTGSGLGCRHWPGCEKGDPLPAKNYHAYIEFGNRTIGAVTILIVLLTAIAAFRTPSLPRWARRLALAVFVGTLLQAPLGYLAVKTDLRWPIVAAHLLLSAVVLAGAVVLALEAINIAHGRAEPIVPKELRWGGIAVVVAGLALLVTGTLATAAGPHSGAGAEHVDRLWRLQPLIYAHAAAVGVFAVALVFVAGYLAPLRERAPNLFVFSLGVLGLLFAQMTIGEIQYRTHLPWPLVLVHVGLAAAVWALLVAFVTVLWRPPRSLVPSRT
ncbi:MAG TPA: COX15/CtaA family protein [Gaiellaceae bacterium]|nr:COX15/CtaA family protein [Gaiellaceae bacterium]